MNIGLDLGFGQSNVYPVFHQFLIKCIQELASALPEHSFTIYNNNEVQEPVSANMSTGVRRERKKLLGIFNLKEESRDGRLIECFYPGAQISSGSILVVPDLSPITYPQHFSRRETRFFQKSLEKAVTRSKVILVTSDYYRKLVLKTFLLPEDKVRVLYYYSEAVQSAFSWQECEAVRASYTGGKEYFVFAGDLHPRFDLVILLKAFSKFKKWQKSNMQLVIAGYDIAVPSPLLSLIQTYKYKDDVVIIHNPSDEERQRLTGAAYAFIYPALYDLFPLTLLKAIRMEVPVISADLPEVREITGDSIVFSSIDEENLSAKMQRIYKDELWRKEVLLKAAGHQRQLVASEAIRPPLIVLQELMAK